MTDRRPNILLLFTDQQRFDTIAALGNPLIKTPALDKLCAEGTAFTRCYTPSPVCVPARMALATGLAPHQTGIFDLWDQGPTPPPESLMQRLAAQGYQTHGVGKMHFVPDPIAPWGFHGRDRSEEGDVNPETNDYRKHLDENGYGYVREPQGVRSEMYYVPQPAQMPDRLHHTTWVGDRSMDFLNSRDTAKPFFLWTSFIKPHPPFANPDPWHKLYRTKEMPGPKRFNNDDQLLTYWNHVQNRYKYRDAGQDLLFIRTMRAAYYACISHIDYQIGRILEALGDDINHTLILFSSDHGELLGDYGCFGKRCMLDAAARVPMIARLPGRFDAGKRCDEPTTLLDIFPTCTAVAGDPHRPSEDGVDLAEVASGRHSGRVVTSVFRSKGYGLYMATSRTGKYIYSEPDQKQWFFDLMNDPEETSPVKEDPEDDTLKQELIKRFKRDGYTEPLNGDDWRTYPTRAIPDDPDDGLLYQDDPDIQARIDKLGPYARRVTIDDRESYKLLQPPD